ncbi:MAG: carboxypeptidase-like regulatory domain-containing protein [Candidatus Micrarchaeia archaeon]
MVERKLIYLLCMAFALAGIASAYNVSFVNSAGSPTTLNYDSPSQSYIDANTNPDIYVRACGLDTSGKYAALAYPGGNATLVISQQSSVLGNAIRIPASAGGCVDIGLDVSSFLAAYPGQPYLVISNDTFVSADDEFYPVDSGSLAGFYSASGTADSENLTIDIAQIGTTAGCTQGNAITGQKSLIVACAHGAANETSCVLASPNGTITVPLNGMAYSYFTLNGMQPVVCAIGCPSGTVMCSDGACRDNCGGGGGPTDLTLNAQVAANCTNETANVTIRSSSGTTFSPSTVTIVNSQTQEALTLQLVSSGVYVFTPTKAGTYSLTASNVGFTTLETGFDVNDCAVPVQCKENDLSCTLDYDCCSGFCNSFGVCANQTVNNTNNQTEGNPPGSMDKQITISIDATCTDAEGTVLVDPKDSTMAVYRIDGGSTVQVSTTRTAIGYSFVPHLAGSYEARAFKPGYTSSTLPFKIFDCTQTPTCTDNGLACVSDAECCSAFCNQTSNLCGQRAPLSTCIEKNGFCNSTADCCVGACVANACSVCSQTLSLCRTSSDCCEGYCSDNKCIIPSSSATTIIGTLADKDKTQSLWPVVVGLAAIAAYAGVTTGVRILPPTVFAIPILVGFVTVPFLGILAGLAEIILEKTRLMDTVFRKKDSKGRKKQ